MQLSHLSRMCICVVSERKGATPMMMMVFLHPTDIECPKQVDGYGGFRVDLYYLDDANYLPLRLSVKKHHSNEWVPRLDGGTTSS